MELIKNVFEIVVPEEWGEEYNKTGTNTCTQTQVGRFTVLYDETLEKEKKTNVQNSTKRNTSKVWRWFFNSFLCCSLMLSNMKLQAFCDTSEPSKTN